MQRAPHGNGEYTTPSRGVQGILQGAVFVCVRSERCGLAGRAHLEPVDAAAACTLEGISRINDVPRVACDETEIEYPVRCDDHDAIRRAQRCRAEGLRPPRSTAIRERRHVRVAVV